MRVEERKEKGGEREGREEKREGREKGGKREGRGER